MTPDGEYSVFGANGIIGKYHKFNHEESQLLITCRGATCGSVNISEPFSWITGNAMVVRPKVTNLALHFVEFFFRGAVDLGGVITGAAQPQITRQSLAPVPIPHPPHEEQQQIVAVLDEAFEGLARARAHAEANLRDARELFTSAVDDLLAQNAGWAAGPISAIVGQVSTGPFGSLLHKSDYVENGTPLINPAHIIAGQIVPDFRKTVDASALQRLASYRLAESDIVIGRRGEMGRCAVVNEDQDGWLCGTGSFFIRPRVGVVPEFVAHLLRSPSFVAKLESASTGATMANLSNKVLGDIPISLPDETEQLRLLGEMDAIENTTSTIANSYRSKIERIDALRQSLLHKAFAGELT